MGSNAEQGLTKSSIQAVDNLDTAVQGLDTAKVERFNALATSKNPC